MRKVQRTRVPHQQSGSETGQGGEAQEAQEAQHAEPAVRSGKYTKGFLKAWTAYPHWQQRSRKAKAFTVWKRLGLEDKTGEIGVHMCAASTSEDWMRDAGKYVPGFQVWINQTDFDEPPKPHNEAKRDTGVSDFGEGDGFKDLEGTRRKAREKGKTRHEKRLERSKELLATGQFTQFGAWQRAKDENP